MTAAVVGKAVAGLDKWRFANYAVALYFSLLAEGVGNEPMPFHELYRFAAFIGNGDLVNKKIETRPGIRLRGVIARFCRNFDTVGNAIHVG